MKRNLYIIIISSEKLGDMEGRRDIQRERKRERKRKRKIRLGGRERKRKITNNKTISIVEYANKRRRERKKKETRHLRPLIQDH